jgi:hypothetical protein
MALSGVNHVCDHGVATDRVFSVMYFRVNCGSHLANGGAQRASKSIIAELRERAIRILRHCGVEPRWLDLPR